MVINDMFLHILKVQTLVTHPNVSLVPKNSSFNILKVQTLVTHPNVSLVPKNRVFMFLKTP